MDGLVGALILHLIRHARPAVRPDQAPAAWPLANPADPELRRLADSGVLPTEARWVSSSEPKASGTARSLTNGRVTTTDALREMHRPAGLLPKDEFLGAVRTSLLVPGCPSRPGWETGTATTERVRAAVRALLAESDGHDLVLVGHGTAWTLLVADLTGTPPDVAGWERLTMPDHCALEVDPPPARVTAPWGAWRT